MPTGEGDANNNPPEAGAGNGDFDFFGASDAPDAAATAATDADDFFAVDDTPAATKADAEDDFFAVDDGPAARHRPPDGHWQVV